MRRLLLMFVLLAATAIALEPVIHTHPLTKSSTMQCAVCVNAHASVSALKATPLSPLAFVGEVAAVELAAQLAWQATPRAPRGPPAA
ncbi:MAG TPA: hypothetical protein VLU46_12125 [Thermoanaerobaculia bacterium]|nr:hypothetical protein [Thermoanaerobaculia bacterium]